MSPREKPTERKDCSSRANEVERTGKSSISEAEARAQRLEQIRQSVIEEWRWRDPERVE